VQGDKVIILDWIFIGLIVLGLIASWTSTVTIIIAVLLVGVFLRWLAKKNSYFLSTPVNTFALITPIKSESTDATKGGGGVVGVLHAVPGRMIDRSSPDPMAWPFVLGVETYSILNFLLLHYLGIQFIGIFRYVRLNEIKDLRLHREANSNTYEVVDRSKLGTPFVFFSENPSILVKDPETKGSLKIDLAFNLIVERTLPLFSIVRVPDVHGQLTGMVRNAVIGITCNYDAEKLVGGPNGQKIKDDIVALLKSAAFIARVFIATGITIIEVNLIDVAFDEPTRALLEKKKRAEIEAAARVIEATGERDAKLRRIEADAREVEAVIMRLAETPGAASIVSAYAYRDNKTVITYAPGGEMGLILPSSNPQATPRQETPSPTPATTTAIASTRQAASTSATPTLGPISQPAKAGPTPKK